MRSLIDNKFLKDMNALRNSNILNQHVGERFNFSVKLLSEVARGITNHTQEIRARSVYANIGGIDYYLQVFKDNQTYFDALILNSHRSYSVCELKDASCNLLTINREYKDSNILIQGHTLYKAEDSVVDFFFRHLDIFLQELERMTVGHILKINASASFLGHSVSLFQGSKYSVRPISI